MYKDRSLLGETVQVLYHLQNNGFILFQRWFDLIDGSDHIFVSDISLQHHHHPSGSIYQLVVRGSHVGHHIRLVTIHPPHDQG